jgi:hypothetical protein
MPTLLAVDSERLGELAGAPASQVAAYQEDATP